MFSTLEWEKMNEQEKRAAVLEAAQAEFSRLGALGQMQIIFDAPRELKRTVDLPPATIANILRGLHRARKIGLREGRFANNLDIAPDQATLGRHPRR